MAKDSDTRHRAQQGGAGRTAQGSAESCCLGGQLGLGKQEAVLRGAPGWVMGVFPRSGTKGQKLIMKHAVLIVHKRGSRHSGARRFPKGLEHLLASLRPPSGAAISHAESCNQCAKK